MAIEMSWKGHLSYFKCHLLELKVLKFSLVCLNANIHAMESNLVLFPGAHTQLQTPLTFFNLSTASASRLSSWQPPLTFVMTFILTLT